MGTPSRKLRKMDETKQSCPNQTAADPNHHRHRILRQQLLSGLPVPITKTADDLVKISVNLYARGFIPLAYYWIRVNLELFIVISRI